MSCLCCPFCFGSLSGSITSVWEESADFTAIDYSSLCGFSATIGCFTLLVHSLALSYMYKHFVKQSFVASIVEHFLLV